MRIFIALAAGAFAIGIPGKINIKNDFVSAGGAIAVVVFIYMVNPAGWKEESDCNARNFRAIVYVDNQLTKDVEVIFPALGKSAFTDNYGAINVEYLPQQISLPFKVIFKYKTVVDTTVSLDALSNNKTEFFLKAKNTAGQNTSLSNNSLSVNFGDLNLNISLINPNKTDPVYVYADTVAYHFSANGDSVFIKPASAILSLLNKGGVVSGNENPWCINLPQFDFKLSNNSDEAIFLNEIQVAVSSSSANNKALIVPSGVSAISFSNNGWGDAKDVKLDFNVVPAKFYKGWAQTSYRHHYQYPLLKRNQPWKEGDPEPSNANDEGGAGIFIDLHSLMKQYGISQEAFEAGEYADLKKPNDPKTKKYKKLAGNYDEGGMAYGLLSYTDTDGIVKQLKFQSAFEISSGYGADLPEGEAYNTKFKTSGNNYQLSSSISRGIKPKDFDRFSLVYGAGQSSKHIFKLSFLYNSKKITLPYVFVLDYFNTPDGV